jgi:alpha-D-ribose 1-methylphosphonate 5-triphosphate synthase subunit PhnH
MTDTNNDSNNAYKFSPAFKNFPYDSQKVFRLLLLAMAYPATIIEEDLNHLFVSPPPLEKEAASILLTLCDFDTGIYLSPSLNNVSQYLSFHTGAKIVPIKKASFALFGNIKELTKLEDLNWGTEKYPDHSTTLIIGGSFNGEGPDLHASGPGIKEPKLFTGHGLTTKFIEERELMVQSFPLGVDIFLVGFEKICALPRTTKLDFKNF